VTSRIGWHVPQPGSETLAFRLNLSRQVSVMRSQQGTSMLPTGGQPYDTSRARVIVFAVVLLGGVLLGRIPAGGTVPTWLAKGSLPSFTLLSLSILASPDPLSLHITLSEDNCPRP